MCVSLCRSVHVCAYVNSRRLVSVCLHVRTSRCVLKWMRVLVARIYACSHMYVSAHKCGVHIRSCMYTSVFARALLGMRMLLRGCSVTCVHLPVYCSAQGRMLTVQHAYMRAQFCWRLHNYVLDLYHHVFLYGCAPTFL
jgi:hypothetical protein